MPVRLVKLSDAICDVKDCTNKAIYEVTRYTSCNWEAYYDYVCVQHTIEYIDDAVKRKILRLEKSEDIVIETELEELLNILDLGHELKIPAFLKEDKYLCGN